MIATVASHKPKGYFANYQKAFDGLGVGELVELYLDSREETFDEKELAILDGRPESSSAAAINCGSVAKLATALSINGFEKYGTPAA